MYGGLEQQLVNDANKGVVADLGGVTARAIGDTATQFKTNKAAQLRAQQRMGINPNSGRAESMARQSGIAQALGTAGNITPLIEKLKDVMLSNKHGIDAPM